MEHGTEGAEGFGWATKTIVENERSQSTVCKMLGQQTLSSDKQGP